MAAIDYWGIKEDLKELLTIDPTLADVSIEVEPEELFSPEMAPWIGIFMPGRTDDNEQSIAAGTRQALFIQLTLVCAECALEKDVAIKKRDNLIGAVEVALLKVRLIGGKVETMQIQGGDFDTGQLPALDTFLSLGEINLRVRATASTA